MSQPQPSENIIGKKLDNCLADSLLKTLAGAAIGTVTTIFMFKAKRTWPIWFGTGIGLYYNLQNIYGRKMFLGVGMGWSNCKQELQQPYLLHGKKTRATSEDGKPTYKIVQEKQ
jgi:inner membrane organizing system protein 1